MALPGQASGGFTESSSALRPLYRGVSNTLALLTPDGFTQTNPPIVTTAGTVSASPGFSSTTLGVLGGSVAFTRPDVGSNFVGGPATVAVTGITAMQARMVRPLGLFLNSAAGNAFENTPAAASGRAPYACGYGTYGVRLFETDAIGGAITGVTTGDSISWLPGYELIASNNGYLAPKAGLRTDLSAIVSWDVSGASLQVTNGETAGTSTVVGLLKMVPDSAQNELVLDLRV